LTTRVLERALEKELTEHLGYEKVAAEGRKRGNSRNGRTKKRVKSDAGELDELRARRLSVLPLVVGHAVWWTTTRPPNSSWMIPRPS